MSKVLPFQLPDILNEFEYPEAVVAVLETLLILERHDPTYTIAVMKFADGFLHGLIQSRTPKLVK